MRLFASDRPPRAATGRETAVVHRIASLLLEYPGDDLVALLPVLRAATAEVTGPPREPLDRLLDHVAATPLADLQADYVATFDLRRRCSPYLTYYAHGDTRKRGVALVEFKEAYRAAGMEHVGEELPDHVAVVLEFASTDGPAQEAGLRLLLDHRAGLELLRMALRDGGSPWADALAAVCATLPPLGADEATAVARLAAAGPPGEDVGLEPFGPPTTMEAAQPAAPVFLPTPGVRR